VLEGADEVLVVGVRLLVAGGEVAGLDLEAGALLVRVVERSTRRSSGAALRWALAKGESSSG
jgi:hypothetical protein